MKKKIALILIFCTLFFFGVSAETTEEDFTEDISVVKATGIMQGNDKGEFMPEECLTRAEFAKIICVMAGWNGNVTAYDKTGFTDLSEDHWGYPYIYFAVSSGFMAGGTDKRFRPDDCITGTEAAKVIINLLGYEFKAEDMGGYPDGYDAAALSLGLYKGLSFNKRDYILRGEVARLINNSLDVPLVEFESVGNEGYKYRINEDKSILTENLLMMRGKAVVTANEYASVKGDSRTPEGKIKIDGIVADYASDSEELLGKRCEYICSYDRFNEEEKEIIYINPLQVKYLTVDRKDYIDFSESSLKYTDKDDIIRSVKVSQTADYIYNGSNTEFNKDLFENIKLGKITLLSTDGSTYDVVKIKDSEVLKVGDINGYSKRITDENDSSKYIDFSDNLKVFDVKNSYGEKLDISSVKKGDVLTVTKGEGKTEIIVSGTKTSGVVEYISYEDGEMGIGGETVELDYYFSKYHRYIKPGKSVTVYKDAYGYAALAESLKADMGNTGYIVKIGGKANPMGEALKIKLYTTSDTFVVADFAETVRINGNTVKNADASSVSQILGNNMNLMAKYELTEDGKLKSLDTAETEAILDAKGTDGFCNMYPLKSRYHMMEGSNFDFEAYYDNNTVFMKVPSDMTSYDERDFRILTKSSFQASVNYNVEGYTESSDDVIASVILTKDDVSGAFEGHDVVAVVEKISRITDMEAGSGFKIKMLAGSYGSSPKEFTLLCFDEAEMNDENGYNVSDLKAGDVVKVMYDGEFELSKFSVYYKYDENKWVSKEAESKTAINRIYPRKVTELKQGFAVLQSETDSTFSEIHELSKLAVIVVRKAGNNTVVRLGEPSDVNVGDRCVIQTVSRKALSLTVFK